MEKELNGMEFAERLQNVANESIFVVNNEDADILYNLKTLPGNRPIKESRVKELKNAFKNGEFIPPILVTLPYRFITEGNHRYKAALECLKEGIPFELRIYFYKDKEALETARLINNTQKRWSANDRLASYCFEHKESYIRLRDFMNKYAEIFKATNTYSVSAALCILSNGRTRGSMYQAFSTGHLKVSEKDTEFGDIIMNELAAISQVLNSTAPYNRDCSIGWIKARTRLGITFPKFLNLLRKKSNSWVCPNQTAKAWFNMYMTIASGL